VTLPLPLRNRLAELILESLHDTKARSVLSALVRFCAEPEPAAVPSEVGADFPAAVRGEFRRFRDELGERTRRAWDIVRDRPLARLEPALGEVLDQAADLFDARLFFEVHELLEPYWMRADGAAREALQGLIQIAVGFQHLVNGNVEGARMLLEEGSAKAAGKRLEGRDLGKFAGAVRSALAAVVALGREAPRAFDWAQVPRFPRGG
jgi:hypothetical protein